jgi:small-conductance mechanosensitive channel
MSQRFQWTIPLCLAILLGVPLSAPGQDTRKAGDNSTATESALDDVHVAPVVVDGETLFSVRGVTARPADRRALEIADRIRSLAANRKITTSSLTLEDSSLATRIRADGQHVMALMDEDAALESTARRALAELYRIRIGEAIESYRRRRQPGVLWLHGLQTLGATLALLLIAWVARFSIARLRSLVEGHYRQHLEVIEDRAFQLVKADQIWRAIGGLLNVVWAVGLLVLVYFYLNFALSLFPWTRAVANSMYGVAIEPLRTIGLGFVSSIPNLIFLTILAFTTKYLLKLTKLFFAGVAGETVKLSGFDPEWAWPTFRLVRLLAILLAVVVAYPYIPGSNSEAFKGVSLFMGVIFSLGSSSLIGNFIAGYSLTYRRVFRVGDRVKIGPHVGIVERVRLLVTHLRTIKNEELVVPNSSIMAAEVINYSSMSREKGLILHTTVGIGYETPWRQVEAMLMTAARRSPGLLREPPPFVLQTLLGDYCVTYELNAFCRGPELMEETYTDLHRNILDVFNEYGVQIMTPSYMHDPAEAKVVPPDQWYAAPAKAPVGTSTGRG